MPDEIFLRQLLMNSGLVWCQTAVLVSFFLAAIFRPERIYHLGLFRSACVLLVLSLALPSVLSALLIGMGGSSGSMRGPSAIGASGVFFSLTSPVGPVLFGLSLLLGLFALLPGSASESRREPPRHPLE